MTNIYISIVFILKSSLDVDNCEQFGLQFWNSWLTNFLHPPSHPPVFIVREPEAGVRALHTPG